jgi:hypothetical protein
MTLYILNTIALPLNYDTVHEATITVKRVTLDEAKRLVKTASRVVSAVGHESTAQLLSRLLCVTIPFNRQAVYLHPGDCALHFVLKTRLPEGRVLDESELLKLDYWLVFSEILLPEDPQ